MNFALKKTAPDNLAGVTTTIAGDFVDVLDRLEKGGGMIATDKPAEIDAFRGLDVLKEISDTEADEIRKPATKKEN